MPKYMLQVEDVPSLDGSASVNVQMAFEPPLPEQPDPTFVASPAQAFGADLTRIIQRMLTPPPPRDDNVIEPPKQ